MLQQGNWYTCKYYCHKNRVADEKDLLIVNSQCSNCILSFFLTKVALCEFKPK